MKRTLASALLALLAASALQADVPLFINYQGRVTDSNGAAIGAGTPVNRKVIFRIWDHPSNTAVGNRLYTEEQTVTIFNGEFSVLIGQGIAFPSGSPEDKPALDTVFGALSPSTTDRYLEILVDNGDNSINTTDQPITPRQQMTSVGYAMRAKVADSVAPGFDLNLNGSPNYGLGYYGGTRLFSSTIIDGPVLFGVSGGALGSDNGTTEITALRWNNSGQVGIGSNTLLGVAGTTKLLLEGNDTTAPPKQLTIRGTDPNKRLHLGYNTTSNYGAIQAYSAASTGANLLLNQAGGNVGIGGTTTPGERLTIVGADTSSTGLALGVWNSTPTNLFLVRNDGNVGIGTASPTQKLDVSGNAIIGTTDNSAFVVDAGGFARLGIVKKAGLDPIVAAAAGSHIVFGQSNQSSLFTNIGSSTLTEYMRIKSGGNVGIGTTDPQSNLQVVGVISARSTNLNNGYVAMHTGGASNDGFIEWVKPNNVRSAYMGYGSGSSVDLSLTGSLNFNITGAGNVGIGTSSPSYAKLVVSGGPSQGNLSATYIQPNSTAVLTTTHGPHIFSIYATGGIRTDNGIYISSDARIKIIDGVSDSAADLHSLLGIEVTNYHFRDKAARGDSQLKKVIAQQLEKVYPQAVSQVTNVVPDIYQKAALKDGWIELKTDLKKGERVRIIGAKEKDQVCEVLEVKKDTFRVDFKLEGGKPSGDKVEGEKAKDDKAESEKVFVYGREVKDFRVVDYEAISMLNVSATQQIKKEKDAEVKLLKDENADLKAKLAAQDTRLATLEAQTQRLADLEAKDKAREAKLAAIEKLLLAADKAAVKPVSLKKSAGGAE